MLRVSAGPLLWLKGCGGPSGRGGMGNSAGGGGCDIDGPSGGGKWRVKLERGNKDFDT